MLIAAELCRLDEKLLAEESADSRWASSGSVVIFMLSKREDTVKTGL